MKKITFLVFILSVLYLNGFSQDYYWVGDGGDWSDTAHWAITSGGSTKHIQPPGLSDNVYFDQNSFTKKDQVVALDTTFSACASMDWTNVRFKPEFYGKTNDTIVITSQLLLPVKDSLSFSHFGIIIFQQTTPAQTLIFNPENHTISSNITVNINAGTLNVLKDLKLPQKKLNVINGNLNLNNNNIYTKHFNTDTLDYIAVTITNPALSNIDSLICYGSIHIESSFDISGFNGYIQLSANASDSNYINFANHNLTSEILLSSSKKYFLLSDLKTTKDLSLNISSLFNSQNHNIICKGFYSKKSLNRTIELGTSEVTTSDFEVTSTGLTLNSSNADLVFSGTGNLFYTTTKKDVIFNNVTVNTTNNFIFSGKLVANIVTFSAGSNIQMNDGTVLEFNGLNTLGDCGSYVQIRALCNDNLGSSCITKNPVLRSANTIIADYLKLSYIEADGNFTANNSFDEGNNINWSINEPTSASTLYWIGNTGVWNDSNNWSATSGGSAQSCIPSKHTNVVFDNNSFSGNDTVKLDNYGYCAAMTWSGISFSPVFDGSGKLFVSDSIVLDPNLVADFYGEIYLENNTTTDTISILSAGVTLNAEIFIEGTAVWDFVDAATIYNNLNFEQGDLTFSGKSITATNFISNSFSPRILDINKTTFNLTGDNEVWDINSTNFTIDADSSNIYISGTTEDRKDFNGADQVYFNLHSNSDYVQINGSNTFNTLSTLAGNTIVLEAGSYTYLDSIDASGSSCSEPISFISEYNDSPATINKTGNNTLTVDYFFIKNIKAELVNGDTYIANSSSYAGDVSGWTFQNDVSGETYYWLGKNSNWHDIINWEVNSVQATCLPTIKDIVIVDPTILSGATTDTITINRSAYCKEFNATGLTNLYVSFNHNLSIESALNIDQNVTFAYQNKFDLEDAEDYNIGVKLIPDNHNFSLNPDSANFDVNLYINSILQTDSIVLSSDLMMDTTSSIIVESGTFEAQNKNIECGFFKTSSLSAKTVNLDKSNLKIFANFVVQDSPTLTFSADSSLITFNGNSINFSKLSGSGQTFFDVVFNGVTGDNDDFIIFIEGDNNFNTLSLNNGINAYFEASQTQQADSAFLFTGTCLNYVTINSSFSGTNFTLQNNSGKTDSAVCVIMNDSEIIPGGYANLSTNESNNIGWIFDSKQAATANFTIPYPVCLDKIITLTNTSTSMYSGNANLKFEWMLEDSTTFDMIDLQLSFEYAGDQVIQLTATDTITQCFNVFEDTFTLFSHQSYIDASDGDYKICNGDSITFTASSDNATEFMFYLNNSYIDFGNTSINEYITDSLKNNDTVRVDAIYYGCPKSSDTIIITVNPLPTVSLVCSDIDTTICAGQNIWFEADGAENYKYVINGIERSYSADSIFSSSSLADQTTVAVLGVDTNGCVANSVDTFTVTVNSLPVVTMLSDPISAVICSEDTLTISASGALEYEFFINGISTGSPSFINTLQSNTIQNEDIFTVQGTDINGCLSKIDTNIAITVNQSPTPELISNETDTTICLGNEVFFYGNGANEFEFFVDNVSQGAFSNTNSFSTNSLTNQQIVTLKGRTGTCVRNAPDTLVFNVFPVINFNASNVVICPNDTVTFTATGDTIYQFFIDGNPVTSLSSANVFKTSNILNGQIVSVKGTDGACEPDAIQITVKPFPSPSLTCANEDTTTCFGDNMSFIGEGAYEYEFFIDGISQGPKSTQSVFTTNSITNNQELTVIGYSDFGCALSAQDTFIVTVHEYPNVNITGDSSPEICLGDTMTFTASGALEYQYFLGNTPQGSFSSNPVFVTTNIKSNQIVTAKGNNFGCVSNSVDTFIYIVNNIPTVNLTAETPVSVCKDDLIRVKATGATTYEFFVNSVSQGLPSTVDFFESSTLSGNNTISVVGYENICSSSSIDTIYIDVNQVPLLNFTSDIVDNQICYGDTAEFYVTGAAEFQFYIDTKPFGTLNSSGFISIPNIDNGDTISVIGYNNACYLKAANVFAPNVNYINLDITTSADQNTLCGDGQITIYATGADMYEFFLNGTSLAAESTIDSIIINGIQNDDYITVSATDLTHNCKLTSGERFIKVNPIPEITVIPDVQFCENDSVTLISNSTIYNQWYYNSSPFSNANEVIVNQSGIYNIMISSGANGGVYSSGENGLGQLGDGTNVQSIISSQAVLEDTVQQISAGQGFVIAIDKNNKVWAWGNNEWGNLGLGNYEPTYIPESVSSLSDITEVATGYHHSLALKSDGTVMSWGQNTEGQLGYGNNVSSNFPMPIASLANIVAIAAGSSHSLALTSTGQVYAWGYNYYGQLGNGTHTNSSSPVLVSGLTDVVFIACGANHSIAIKSDGTLWVWGNNSSGQLGINNYNSSDIPVQNEYLKNMSKADGGMSHTVAVSEKGEIYTWGDNTYGQIGVENISESKIPVKLALIDVTDVTCGFYNTFVIKEGAGLWAWGLNNYGQLGDQTTINKKIPTRASQYNSIKDIAAGEKFMASIWNDVFSCSSEDVVLTSITVPNVTITQNGSTLSTIEGISYQWFYNGSLIPNSNSQSITASALGYYSVEVTFSSGCSEISDEYSFVLDLDEWATTSTVKVYPNPNSGIFELKLDLPENLLNSIYNYQLISAAGAIVETNNNFKASESQKFEFKNLSSGMYYLILNSDFGKIKTEIIIK